MAINNLNNPNVLLMTPEELAAHYASLGMPVKDGVIRGGRDSAGRAPYGTSFGFDTRSPSQAPEQFARGIAKVASFAPGTIGAISSLASLGLGAYDKSQAPVTSKAGMHAKTMTMKQIMDADAAARKKGLTAIGYGHKSNFPGAKALRAKNIRDRAPKEGGGGFGKGKDPGGGAAGSPF